ncbi:hypothetical protein [Niastella sp. OAS944]|uniref:hypothetical protein n=1 Tax=Niastella sp. OAS944 TaxID=2664089 RepID=UPI003493E3CD|nr:hypothetical protein [Chitinophagaceae bacterium OAS944]
METAVITSPRVERIYKLMKLTYGLVPIVAGLDKFTNLLTDWEKYLNPTIAKMLPFSPHTFMLIVGVIEVIAGLIVLFRPAFGAYIVSAWLALIGLSLLANGGYLDVAVRDLVMAIGAYSLAQLARVTGTTNVRQEAKSNVSFSRG